MANFFNSKVIWMSSFEENVITLQTMQVTEFYVLLTVHPCIIL